MGYRAQVITKEREYGSSIFTDWEQFDEYYGEMMGIYDNGLNRSESMDFYEIEKTVIEEEIKRLKSIGEDEEFSVQSHWNDGEYKDLNKHIIEAWETALKESPKDSFYVSLEWY